MKGLIKNWFKKPSYDEQLALNLYATFVLDSGPWGDKDKYMDCNSLEIRVSDLKRFSEKKIILMEVFLFASVVLKTSDASKKLFEIFGSQHPLAEATQNLLFKKWQERGIAVESVFDVSEACFDEIELFLDKPFKWGREWLSEFYESADTTGNFVYRWTDQCLKQFKTMQSVVSSSLQENQF